ncbi:uncharacterized protein [Anas platyrhynchos]|uniref:uncharacterized protein n=1 Tax=Anas platyrhynchos TaxID=8839 RepID=UPI003AF2E119
MEQGVLEVLNVCGEWKTPRRAAKSSTRLQMSVPSTLLVLFFPGGWTSTMWDSRSLPWSPSLMPGVYRTSGAQDSVLQRTNSSDRCLCFTEGFNIFSCLRGQTAMLVLFTSSLPVFHVRGKTDSHHVSLLEVPGGEAILFDIPEESNGDENRGQRGKPPGPCRLLSPEVGGTVPHLPSTHFRVVELHSPSSHRGRF